MYRYLCRIFLRLFPRADCCHCLSVFWWSNSFASESYHSLQICPNGQKFCFSQCFQWDDFFALWRRKTMKFRQWMGRLVSAKSYGPGVLEFEGGCSKAECLRSCWTRNSSCCIHLTRRWGDLESDIAWISIWSQQIAHFLVHFKGTEFRSFLRWIFPLILLIRRPVRCLRRGRCSLLLQWETKGGRNKCEKQPSWIQKNGWQILPKCFSLFPYISITVSIIWTWGCLKFPPARTARTISWQHTSPEIWRSWIFACRWTTQHFALAQNGGRCLEDAGFWMVSQASAGKHGQRSFIAIAQETIEFNLQSFKVGVLQFRLEIS
jgi:hypothetical protein